MNNGQTHSKEDFDSDVLLDKGCSLILYNDDVHTFDYVIQALKEICGHGQRQAEQCTLMVHLRGKCVVMQGPREELLPCHKGLSYRGLYSEIVC